MDIEICSCCGKPKKPTQHTPATELAAAWEGYRYGGQAIKPAFEPIVLFQKPYERKPIDSIVKHGAGAINIDGGRVGTQDTLARVPAYNYGVTPLTYRNKPYGGQGHINGRWPANLILAHNPDCNGACSPGCAVAALGEQSGVLAAGGDNLGVSNTNLVYGDLSRSHPWQGHDDTGTAARYFYNTDWMLDRLDENPLRYVAKPDTTEREAGLDTWESTTVDDGRKKSIDNAYQRGETQRKNIHPTVKPIDLCRYLATLLLPPAMYTPRRLLVPFSGSGSEMIGAGIAGWDECLGIELEAEHVAIAEARLAWWIDVFGGRS